MIPPMMPIIAPPLGRSSGPPPTWRELFAIFATIVALIALMYFTIFSVMDWLMCSPRCTLAEVVMNKLRFFAAMRVW